MNYSRDWYDYTPRRKPSRCSTDAVVTRADMLKLGDQILVLSPRYGMYPKQSVSVLTVTELRLVGDDVEINDGAWTTSVGNTFHVVNAR